MADSNRRNRFAAIALPFLFLTMAGRARAATITVDTLSPGSVSGHCSLADAIIAANVEMPENGCAAGTGTDTIEFSVTGTIGLTNILPSVENTLTITGPAAPGITISGSHSVQVMVADSSATLNLQGLTIANGQTSSSGGGVNSAGALTVTNCTFSGNSAGFGGGIFNDAGTVTVINSTFSDNIASGSEGGGIANHQGTLGIAGTTFVGNQAPGGTGGAVFSNGISQIAIINSTFSDNSASDGGAIFDSIDSNITVTNSTFSGNQADISGGAVFNNNGGVSLKASILAVSTGGNCSGTVADAGYNISDDNSCGFVAPSINGSTTLRLDPAGLANNGGPTQTIALEPNSQAVDFIPVASCKDQSSPTPLAVTTDQRDFPRPDSGNLSFCDAGAFELQTGRITVVPGSEQIQIARPTGSADSDQVNLAFTFIDHGSPIVVDSGGPIPLRCDAGNNALNGTVVDLFAGTCASLATTSGGLLLDLSPFAVHTVDSHTYGTIFQSDPPDMLQQMSETVSARMVTLSAPIGGSISCGEWTLSIEVAGLDSAAIGLGGGNPFALVLEDGDKNVGCFDVTNAVAGNQLDPPRKVRRGARRGRR